MRQNTQIAGTQECGSLTQVLETLQGPPARPSFASLENSIHQTSCALCSDFAVMSRCRNAVSVKSTYATLMIIF